MNKLGGDLTPVDREYIWRKNRLDRRNTFSSESDLECYLIFSLKTPECQEYKGLQKLLSKYECNELNFSEIYNQFIFGKAYPCDILILNQKNINVFELKKDKLSQNTIPQIEKEIKKHLYYSIYSDRTKSNGDLRRFNFYLICSKDQNNKHFKKLIYEKYSHLCSKLNNLRENTITVVEYHVNNNILLLEEV
jgi:transposase